jgi:hypothetical protein
MDRKVFISSKETTCIECGEALGVQAWITLIEGKEGSVCLPCADLDHLVYLPAGDAALTRRSAKYSALSAVVLKWSRARKRYERQGILVEEAGLERAEEECLKDEDARAQRREREAEKRVEIDQDYLRSFARRVRELFPLLPTGREQVIAEHACQKYSGRVGRSASAKSLEEKAILLAVTAHIRHSETQYDRLLADGEERHLAREQIKGQINQVLRQWKG